MQQAFSSVILCWIALISNQDRHHENWAILLNLETREKFLCPSYDHASSLGCTERDHKRKARLETKDRGYTVGAYVARAMCPLHKAKNDKNPLRILEAFKLASRQREEAAKYWLRQLELIDEKVIADILQSVPEEAASTLALQFAEKMILENKRSLLCALN